MGEVQWRNTLSLFRPTFFVAVASTLQSEPHHQAAAGVIACLRLELDAGRRGPGRRNDRSGKGRARYPRHRPVEMGAGESPQSHVRQRLYREAGLGVADADRYVRVRRNGAFIVE